jgi:hypothetical protein
MKQTGLGKPNQLERVALLEKNAEATSMGVRVSQMLLQQMLQRVTQLEERLGFVLSSNSDLQFRLLALQKVTGVNIDALQLEADKIKLDEWTKASEEDNAARGLVPASEVVDQDSIVVITSTTPGAEDKGIFRSKVSVIEIGSKEAIEAFQGKKPGDKFELELAGNTHVVELLEVYAQQKESQLQG